MKKRFTADIINSSPSQFVDVMLDYLSALIIQGDDCGSNTELVHHEEQCRNTNGCAHLWAFTFSSRPVKFVVCKKSKSDQMRWQTLPQQKAHEDTRLWWSTSHQSYKMLAGPFSSAYMCDVATHVKENHVFVYGDNIQLITKVSVLRMEKKKEKERATLVYDNLPPKPNNVMMNDKP